MSSSKPTQSLNSVLREVATSNKCISKIGTNISQFFVQLKVKDVGDTSVINKHKNTKTRQTQSNKLKEDTLFEEGRLKVIKSDLKRAQQDRNSVKDLGTMELHLVDHGKRIKSQYTTNNAGEKVTKKDAPKIKLSRVLPPSSINSAFKSPTRMQLQDYEAKEQISKPNAVTYHPRFGMVEKSEGRPTSYTADIENLGKLKKRQMFEQKQLVLCNRLAHKIDRGHEIGDQKLRHNESYLDDHPSGFQRKGSMEDHYHHSSTVSALINTRSPSLKNLSMQNLTRGKRTLSTLQQAKTTLPTNREESEELLKRPNKNDKTVENFKFHRDRHNDAAYKTGDGQINVRVSSITSINYDPSYDDRFGPEESLKIEKRQSEGDTLRNTQPSSILPAVIGASTANITDFANANEKSQQHNDNNYNSRSSPHSKIRKHASNRPLAQSNGNAFKQSNHNPSKRLVMMSKVDSQLSIQQQSNDLHVKTSISDLQHAAKNISSIKKIPLKQQNNLPKTAVSKSDTKNMLRQASSTLIDLKQGSPRKSKQTKTLGYEVTYGTKNYHLVRNRNFFGNEDSIELVPNRSTISESRLPRVKMNLQTNRPPNLAQLHDARFETFNKEPKILSSVKKVSQIDFNNYDRKERHKCLVNVDSDIGMQKYQINESVIKKRTDLGNMSMNRHVNWSQVQDPTLKEKGPDLETYDQLKAVKQMLKKTSAYKTTGPGINGPISYDRQAPRKFTHFQVAELSEKQERAIELAHDEDYQKEQRKIKQKAIMNIHSRIGVKKLDSRKSVSPNRMQYQRGDF